jgi:hypothetical protein
VVTDPSTAVTASAARVAELAAAAAADVTKLLILRVSPTL